MGQTLIFIFWIPTYYTYLKYIINETLSLGILSEYKLYTQQFFKIEPTNPRVLQNFIKIFLNNKKPNLLVELFKEMIHRSKGVKSTFDACMKFQQPKYTGRTGDLDVTQDAGRGMYSFQTTATFLQQYTDCVIYGMVI